MNATLTRHQTVNQLLRGMEVEVNAKNLQIVADVMGRKSVTKTVRVPGDKALITQIMRRLVEANRLKSEDADSDPRVDNDVPAPAEKPAERQGQLVTTSKRKSKGAFEPIRLMGSPRISLTPADRMTLSQMQQIIDTVKKFQGARREARPLGKTGKVEVQDLLRSERWISMTLPEYQARDAQKTLPPLHPRTIEELALPLSRLSLVNHTCNICLQPLEKPYYRGMLEHILAGNAELPHKPNDRKSIKYPARHKGCPAILGVLTQIELTLEFLGEGDEKESARLVRLMDELQKDGGRLLSAYMQSEHRPLSAKEAKARIMSIIEHVKRAREEFAS